MKLALLFSGQGSQKKGMGKDIYEAFPAARAAFDSEAAGFDIKQVCFESPDGSLDRTRFQQAALGAFGAAVTAVLYSNGVQADAACGLSLGEYTALHAAGVLSTDVLLDLLSFRGRVMEETTAGTDSKMSAVLGLGKDLVQRAAAEASEKTGGTAVCANYNCPSQIVIGGTRDAVTHAEALCMEFGAKRTVPLNVSGPFHTPLMQEASVLLGEKLRQTDFKPFRIPVIFNTDAKASADTGRLASVLTEQVKSPVLFEQSILELRQAGIDTAVEIGAVSTLSSFVRKTAPEIKTYSADSAQSLHNILKTLGELS